MAAWRAVWTARLTNPVYAARYRHLTTRKHNQLRPTQAQTVLAAAILRHLHAVITTGQTWDPVCYWEGAVPLERTGAFGCTAGCCREQPARAGSELGVVIVAS